MTSVGAADAVPVWVRVAASEAGEVGTVMVREPGDEVVPTCS